MYEIRPETVKTFIIDKNIKLPRFQRKQTWDDKKNFKLCISLFIEYPMGVTILSVEDKGGKKVRWLLDGRQRRNALMKIYQDPENIYNWAKKFIGFKNSDAAHELEEKFRYKINEYIEFDDDTVYENGDEPEDNSNFYEENEQENEQENQPKKVGLELLLEIIKLIHNKKNNLSGFTRPFDFTNFIKKATFLEISGNNKLISSRNLKNFIDEYTKHCNEQYCEYQDKESFISFIEDRCHVTDVEALVQHVTINWKTILSIVEMVEKLDDLLARSHIGLIEVKNLSASDSQKIFNIINSEGTQLTAVEVLSAKPSWNIPLEDVSSATKEKIRMLYKEIGSEQMDVVKWDLPAVFMQRLGDTILMGSFSGSQSDFAKSITFGFKVLAGIWEHGVTKNHIEQLSRNSKIEWANSYESIIDDIKNMIAVLQNSTYFKFFTSWKTSIRELTSDAVALNFLISIYKIWVQRGRPSSGSSGKVAKKFQHDALLMWDRLIYEYITGQWRGSSDSKIAARINEINKGAYCVSLLEFEKWNTLFTEMLDTGLINGCIPKTRTLAPVIYHFYCLNSIAGPNMPDVVIEVDHIMAQNDFKIKINDSKLFWKDNLFNLALLPKSENCCKSDKKLSDISDKWLIQQIVSYTGIAIEDFEKFSSIEEYGNLYKQRYDQFIHTFSKFRVME